MKLILPYPPSVNMYWRHARGRTYLSAAGAAYRAHVWALVRQAGATEPILGPVCLTIDLAPPDRRRRDLDNTFKALFDALEFSEILEDDRQVREIHARFVDPQKGGSVLVSIEKIH